MLAVGPAAELEHAAPAGALRIDARGATVTPGLTDAHLHLVQWARSLAELDLSGLPHDAVIAKVAAAAAARPDAAAPIVGRGWDANRWAEPPHRSALDRAAGARCVLLHSHDFHNLWVNTAALAAAGITRATPDPDGGRIGRDAAGEPTGVLQEHAVRLCRDLLAGARGASDADLVRAAVKRLHREGVTAVHDFEGPDAERVLRALGSDPADRVRVLMHLAHSGLDEALAAGLESGLGDDWFRTGAVKLFADGTLGSRTAALLEPYEGTTDAGFELIPPRELRGIVARAVAGGISVAVHAIGDRAVRSTLDAIEAAGAGRARLALAPRIEHVQLLDPADRPRFARLGVAASMQPSHCVADREIAERGWGSRVVHSYPWRSLLDDGALLAFGSDAPVEPPSVAAGLAAAVTRRLPGDAGAFVPEQAVSLDQALTAYTEAPARLAGAWPRVGTLRPEARADLVVWNADLHALDPIGLSAAYPMWTLLDGRIVHEAGRGEGVREGVAAAAAGAAPPRGGSR